MSDLARLLRISFASQARGLHTACPGRVVSYDKAKQCANVQPTLDRSVNGQTEKMPVVIGVPVIFPRGGGASITFPVKAGDGCLLIFCERSLDEWKGDGKQAVPDDPRFFDLSDAVAIMGLVDHSSGGGSDGVEIKLGSSTFTLEDGQVTVDSQEVIINAPNTTVQGNMTVQGSISGQGGMSVQGSLSVDGGNVTNNGVDIGSEHVHGGVEPGNSTTDGPE